MNIIKLCVYGFLINLLVCNLGWSNEYEMLYIPYEKGSESMISQRDDIVKEVSEIINRHINLKYVSEEQFFNRWADYVEQDAEERDLLSEDSSILGKDFINGLVHGMRNYDSYMEDSLRLHFDGTANLGTTSEQKRLWGIDYVYFTHIYRNKEKDGFKIRSRILNVDNGRFMEKWTRFEELEVKGIVLEHTQILLGKSLELSKVYADRVLDIHKSVVGYDLSSIDGHIVTVEIDYTGLRPNPGLQNVKFNPPTEIQENGTKSLKFQTIDNQVLIINYIFRNGGVEDVQIRTDPPDFNQKVDEVLRLQSQSGYTLRFVFTWDKKKLVNVKVEPEVNPYP